MATRVVSEPCMAKYTKNKVKQKPPKTDQEKNIYTHTHTTPHRTRERERERENTIHNTESTAIIQ